MHRHYSSIEKKKKKISLHLTFAPNRRLLFRTRAHESERQVIKHGCIWTLCLNSIVLPPFLYIPVNAETFFIHAFFCSFWWYTTREKTECVCVFTTSIYELKTDIRKGMGSHSLSCFFVCVFFFWTFYLGHKKKDRREDERQGNMRQPHRLRIEMNDKRWI